jgi:hypothetical protein
MSLFDELKNTGVRHTASILVGAEVRISAVEVIIDGPREGDAIDRGMWRGVLVDAPMEKIYCEREPMLKLDDGRVGKILIMRVDLGRVYFKGISPLVIPPSPEEEEAEILRILDEINDHKA